MDLECRVLLLEAAKGAREVRCLLSYGLDCERDNWLRDKHRSLVSLKDVILSILC